MYRKSQLRIIGGDWRSRKLQFPDIPDIRPSPQRVRETLFNWLTPKIEGATCLDLFAGSGALSFEAVSRGATSAILIECNMEICAQIKIEAQRFGTKKINAVCARSEQYIKQTKQSYDIIFVDPPFYRKLVETTIMQLSASDCVLPKKTLVYVEHEAEKSLELPPNWQWWRQSRAGEVGYGLLIVA